MRKFWFFPHRLEIGIEAHRNNYQVALEVQIGGDEGEIVTFHVNIPFIIRFWLMVQCWPLQHALHLPDEARNTGFYFSWPIFHVEIWQKIHEWRQGDWSWSWLLDDLIFGRAQYSRIVYHTEHVNIPMPEAEYPAKVELHDEYWKRPRKKTVHRRGAWVEIDGDGIPHPGKGTTSYNCDDDALMAMGANVETVWEAVKEVIKQVNWYREHYPL